MTGEYRRIDVAYVLVRDEQSRVLLVQNETGIWTLPGGTRENGETFREAAVREAREETGLEVEVGDVVQVRERVREEHALFITFKGKVVGGEFGRDRPADILDARWMDLAEAQALLPFYPGLDRMAETGAAYLSRLTGRG